jgi:putative membrane protein
MDLTVLAPLLTSWRPAPGALAGLALLAGAYTGVLAAGRRQGAAVRWRHTLCFGAGLLALLLALLSPLDVLADTYLLSAHMLQHLLLLLVAPPLVLLGLPAWLLRRLRPFRRGRWLVEGGRQPLAALLAFTIVVGGWHLPPLYTAALRDEALHAAEHLSMLGVAGLFWWPVVAPVPEADHLGPLGRVLYLFAANAPVAAVAAPLTFAPQVLYPPYLAPGDRWGLLPLIRDGWGLSPLLDQQLAGLLMWVPMTLVLTVTALTILLRWFDAPASTGDAEATDLGRAGHVGVSPLRTPPVAARDQRRY